MGVYLGLAVKRGLSVNNLQDCGLVSSYKAEKRGKQRVKKLRLHNFPVKCSLKEGTFYEQRE